MLSPWTPCLAYGPTASTKKSISLYDVFDCCIFNLPDLSNRYDSMHLARPFPGDSTGDEEVLCICRSN